MRLEHSFSVPVGVEDAWHVLLDIERIAPCLPGAAVASVDGDDITGSVKMRLGPVGLTYKGTARFIEKDEGARRLAIEARGKDARGNSTASATVTAILTPDGSHTKVDVLTDLEVTGRPAQFGHGIMADVGNKLIGQFADCLAGKLTGDPAAGAASQVTARTAPPAGDGEHAGARSFASPAPQAYPSEQGPAAGDGPLVAPIDLMATVGPVVARRSAVVIAAAVAVLVVGARVIARRGKHRAG